MADDEKSLLRLPENGRPLFAAAPTIPHRQRSAFEAEASARRTCDPLTGIRAVLMQFAAQNDAAMPCHHFVPGPGHKHHEHRTLTLVNESRRIRAINRPNGHPLVENGLSDPDQWTIVIAVGREPQSDQYSEWQVWASAALVRQCWRRYPNLRNVVSASLFDLAENEVGLEQLDFLKRLFAAVLDDNDRIAL